MNFKITATSLFLLICFNLQAQYKTKYVVAQDGSGDFPTIQQAIDDSKAFPDQRITIMVKNGVYHEKVKVHSWNTNLSLIGEDKEKTIITYNDYFVKINRGRNSTFFTWTLLVEGDDFIMENITVANSAGEVGQAVALQIEADRCVIKNCEIRGNQDTLYLSGERNRQYFSDCLIEGTTDFIFGSATAVFDNCTIYCKKNSYITAASTPEGVEYGYVFINCKISASQGVKEVYLGRPWRAHAKTVFMDCYLGDFIAVQGWHSWNNDEKKNTVYYAEYGNKGPGAKLSDRIKWSYQLTKEESERYTLSNIFSIRKDPESKKDWYQLQ